MSRPVQLYYITDMSAFPGNEASRRQHLLNKISEAASAGVNYIQLREKDLPAAELEKLAREAIGILRDTRNSKVATRLLINSRADIALAVESDGVHLRGDDVSPRVIAALGETTRNSKPEARNFLTAVSCHSAGDVRRAQQEGANFAVLGPVFEKTTAPQEPALGLQTLRLACQGGLPVYALGGITLENFR